jgi:hypothetical protein
MHQPETVDQEDLAGMELLNPSALLIETVSWQLSGGCSSAWRRPRPGVEVAPVTAR